MDNKTNDKGPSSTEDSEMKVGDKVWVQCRVIGVRDNSVHIYGGCGASWWMYPDHCRPVEPDHDDHFVEFKVGDRVVSWSGRQGVVEAINEIEGFPITVRHSMREQVSYKLGGVKHDHHPVEPSSSSEIPDSSSDPINPSHYKQGPAETIDIIEAAISKAPSNKAAGLHWQVLKYALRCWFKNGIEDLKKARWYLDRLIQEEEAK
jgi:hypothetical protein